MSRVTAIVAAAGRGTRLGQRKQLMELFGRPVVAWCLDVFAAAQAVDDVVVVCEADERAACELLARSRCGSKLRAVVCGGERRQDSVLAGLRAAMPGAQYVVIHDGARPFVTTDMIDRCLAAARETGGATVAVRVKDTIKQSIDGAFVTHSLPRDSLWSAQTPQAFAFDELYAAHQAAEEEGFVATDDAMLVERSGRGRVAIVEGSYDNLKITTAEDLAVAERIARRRAQEA